MLLKTVGCGLFAILFATTAKGALIPSFVLDQQDVGAYDGTNAVQIDTYIFQLWNTGSSPVTAIELEFSGEFYTVPGVNVLFRNYPALPQILGASLADSWFVADGTEIVVEGVPIDTTTTLAAAWAYPGEETAIVPANSTTALAYFCVPTRTEVTFVGGRAKIDGLFIDMPSDILLGGARGLDSDLQRAFDNRTSDQIVAQNVIHLSNGHIERDLDALGEISTSVVFDAGMGDTFATGQLVRRDGSGAYHLVIEADWSSLPKGQVLSGTASCESEFGAPDNYYEATFSITVPEPSTFAIAGLALFGLMGFAHRK